MKRMRMSRAQSVSEYSICVLIIILATIAMQVYVKRGLQGRYADVTDFVTTQAQLTFPKEQVRHQYEPYYQKEDLGFTQDVTEQKEAILGGQVNRVISRDALTRKGTIEDLINYDDDKIK